MVVDIDYRSRVPLYLQIVTSVERLAASGVYPPDMQLPSVRAWAVELSLNPNTVARALSELEARGVVYTVPGKGSFIAPDTGQLRRQAQQQLLRRLAALAREAQSIGLPAAQWQELTAGAWDQAQAAARGEHL